VSEISSINVQSFVDEQEWKLHNYILTHKGCEDKIFEGSHIVQKHPYIATRCHASRRFGYYVWNIILVRVRLNVVFFLLYSVIMIRFRGGATIGAGGVMHSHLF